MRVCKNNIKASNLSLKMFNDGNKQIDSYYEKSSILKVRYIFIKSIRVEQQCSSDMLVLQMIQPSSVGILLYNS
jgi:hypothetical protein